MKIKKNINFGNYSKQINKRRSFICGIKGPHLKKKTTSEIRKAPRCIYLKDFATRRIFEKRPTEAQKGSKKGTSRTPQKRTPKWTPKSKNRPGAYI